jgi:hypothetical protein
VAAGAAACSADSAAPVAPGPSGPSFKKMHVPPPPGVDGPGDTVTVAHRETPLDVDVTRSAVIGAKGGTLEIPEAGARLVVPANAVSADVTFTMTALAGVQAAYEFGPHGTTFAQPVHLEQSTRGMLIPGDAPTSAGYFTDRADLDNEETVGSLRESRPGKADRVAAKLTFDIEHFSGYVVAYGRTTR